MKKLLLILIGFCLISTFAKAQSFRETLKDPTLTFLEKETIIDAYFSSKEIKSVIERKEFKKYNRWKIWASSRLNKEGFVLSKEAENEILRAYGQQKSNFKLKSASSNSKWEELGPFTYEGNSEVRVTGAGMGRIVSIAVDQSQQIIYATAPNGGLWKSTDAGESWVPLGDKFESMEVQGVGISPNNSNIVMIYNQNYLRKSTDGGITWKTVSPYYSSLDGNTSILFHPTNANIIYSGTGDGIAKSTDGGETFNLIFTDFWIDQLRFKPGNPEVIYGTGRRFAKSTDGGNNFSEVTTGFKYVGQERIKVDVSPASPESVFVIQSDGSQMGAIYRSDNGGNSFYTIYDVKDGGKNQLVAYQASRNMHLTVSDTDADVIHVGGALEHYRSTNGGSTFEKLGDWEWGDKPTYIHADVLFMQYVNGRLYAGTDGGLFRSLDKGDHFEDLTNNGLSVRMYYRIGVSKSNPELVIGGTQDIGHSIVRGEGKPSLECLGGDGFECAFDPTNPNVIYAITAYGGFLYKSTNGGKTFKDKSFPGGKTSGSAYAFAVSQTQQNTIYQGVDHGYNRTNKNESGSWINLTASLPSPSKYIKEICVSPSNENYIYITRWNTNDAIWLSKNAESSNPSWTKLNNFQENGSINFISVDPNQPKNIGFVTGEGEVYISQNEGNDWISIKRNLPSAPIYSMVHDHKSNNGIYVGTGRGIYYTNDNMTSWVPFDNNFPNVRVNDLEIHEETGKLYAGTFGRGLWIADLYDDENNFSVTTPTKLKASTVSGSIINLTWIDNSSNETGFEIQRAKENGAFTTITTVNANSTSYSNSGLDNYTSYRYRIRAKNGANQYSKYSNISEAKTYNNDNTSAYNVTLNIIPDEFPGQISWELKDENGEILEFGGDYQTTNTKSEHFLLSAGCYSITMKDSYGDGIWCNPDPNQRKGSYDIRDEDGNILGYGSEYGTQEIKEFCIGETSNPVTISAPSNLATTSTSSNSIGLSWTDNSSNETSFVIERKTGFGSFSEIATVGTNITTYTNNQLTASTSYTYRVKALGTNATNSNYSNELSATTDGTVGGGGQTNVTLTITPDNYAYEISWEIQDVNGTVLHSGNGYSGTNIITESFALSTACYKLIMKDSGNDGICCDFGTGSYELKNEDGTILASGGEYVSEDIKDFCLDGSSTPIALNAPSNIIASVNVTTVNLQWTDNSSNETGFRLQRAKVNGGFTTISNLGVNITSYSDQGLDENTSYKYRVRAIGNNSELSTFSNTANVTTGSVSTGGGNKNVTLTIVLDNYPEEMSWDLKDNGGNVIESGNNYSGSADVVKTFDLSSACYTFTIKDQYGDGICCGAQGNGSYELKNETGTILASGGDYKDEESTQFCLDGSANQRITKRLIKESVEIKNIHYFPNPLGENDDLNIILEEDVHYSQLFLLDVTGRVIYQENISDKKKITVSTKKIPSGTYFIRFINDKEIKNLILLKK